MTISPPPVLPLHPVVEQSYDRVVSDVLLHALLGPLASVLAWRLADVGLRDLQLRREPKGKRSWVSLYLGLTSVLNIEENGAGRFRLTAAATHCKAGGGKAAWSVWQPLADLAACWSDVEAYLHRVVPLVDDRWTDSEGRVHALLANSAGLGAAIINREASHSFRNEQVRQARRQLWSEPLASALKQVDAPGLWWSSTTKIAFGSSPDFIAVDEDGRLLIIEAKPANATAGISLAPAQVACYAAMYATWFQEHPGARASLEAELAQRKELGLLPEGARTVLAEPVRIVPVIAIGPGPVSPAAWGRLVTVAQAVASVPQADVDPLRVWVLDAAGTPTDWSWATSPGAPVTSPDQVDLLTYRQRARLAAQRWKEDVLGLEDGGLYAGASSSPHPFVLPGEHASANLLPGVEGAVALFQEEHIRWHRAINGGPTNHLLSSQVQCVNALYPAVSDPGRLVKAFGDCLDIEEVLPIEDDRFVAFEYVGTQDLLNEGAHMGRGFGRTSIDAAFRYRTRTGVCEMALVEWKYTEAYSATHLSGNDAVRLARYGDLWRDPKGPIRSAEYGDGKLWLADVLVEPFYQLVRQQLLAWRLEQTGVADVVRVLHVTPMGNTAYQASLPRPALRALGSSVRDVWAAMLRPSFAGRSLWLDSARFLGPDVRSLYYYGRYGQV